MRSWSYSDILNLAEVAVTGGGPAGHVNPFHSVSIQRRDPDEDHTYSSLTPSQQLIDIFQQQDDRDSGVLSEDHERPTVAGEQCLHDTLYLGIQSTKCV